MGRDLSLIHISAYDGSLPAWLTISSSTKDAGSGLYRHEIVYTVTAHPVSYTHLAPIEEALPIYGCNIYLTSENPDGFHTPIEVTSLPTCLLYTSGRLHTMKRENASM